jgi:hypothetical protein
MLPESQAMGISRVDKVGSVLGRSWWREAYIGMPHAHRSILQDNVAVRIVSLISARGCEIGLMRVNIQCVDDTRNITQNRQQDVDEEIGIATSLEEDT